jgi:hypothetical protein
MRPFSKSAVNAQSASAVAYSQLGLPPAIISLAFKTELAEAIPQQSSLFFYHFSQHGCTAQKNGFDNVFIQN